MNMRVWAVANQKGGVGKTTTAVALAGLLAEDSARTLLVDMDPHGSLTTYLGFDAEAAGPGVYELFRAKVGDAAGIDEDALIRKTAVAQLFLMPSSPAMATLDRQLGARAGMGLVLAEALQRLNGRFDRVVIDCPPMLGVLMINALVACERLIIPTQTEFLALGGLQRMLRSLAMVERSRGVRIPYLVVPTLFDSRTRASQSCLESLKADYPGAMSRVVVPTDTQVREASRAGLPVGSWPAARRAGEAYRALKQEVLELEQPLAQAGAA